jgi:hypothetical protein
VPKSEQQAENSAPPESAPSADVKVAKVDWHKAPKEVPSVGIRKGFAWGTIGGKSPTGPAAPASEKRQKAKAKAS